MHGILEFEYLGLQLSPPIVNDYEMKAELSGLVQGFASRKLLSNMFPCSTCLFGITFARNIRM